MQKNKDKEVQIGGTNDKMPGIQWLIVKDNLEEQIIILQIFLPLTDGEKSSAGNPPKKYDLENKMLTLKSSFGELRGKCQRRKRRNFWLWWNFKKKQSKVRWMGENEVNGQ